MFIPTLLRQKLIELIGKPVKCLILVKRSSSQAASIFPSDIIHAAVSA